MEPTMSETAGVHFVDFTLTFFNLAKTMFRHENQIRVNSLAFQVLLELNQLPDDAHSCTMSDLADCLRITKQQLTKLVNDLEEKNLVERVHDKSNRRNVYITITREGRCLLKLLYREMLRSTLRAFSSYTEEELLQMDQALVALNRLLEKFDVDCCCGDSAKMFADDSAKASAKPSCP